MGCCNSFKLETVDIEVALNDVTAAKSPLRDPEGFADVSLGSHSESNTSIVQETHPVFLMNSMCLPGVLQKERSITVPNHPVLGLDSPRQSFAALTTPKFGGEKLNPRSVSYSGAQGPIATQSVLEPAAEF